MKNSGLSEETKLRIFGGAFIVAWIAFSIGVLALAAYAVTKAVSWAGMCA